MLNKYLMIFLLIIIVNLYYCIKLENFENKKEDKLSRNYYSLGCWKFINQFTLPIKLKKNYTTDECYKEAIKRGNTMFGLINKKCYLGNFNKNYNYYKYFGSSSRCKQDGIGNETNATHILNRTVAL